MRRREKGRDVEIREGKRRGDQRRGNVEKEGSYEKKIGEVDGVSGATLNWDQGRGIPLQFDHEDPSKQALIDFRDNIVNNTLPVSNAKTGAMAATCVQMGLDAMYDDVIMSKPQQG